MNTCVLWPNICGGFVNIRYSTWVPVYCGRTFVVDLLISGTLRGYLCAVAERLWWICLLGRAIAGLSHEPFIAISYIMYTSNAATFKNRS